MGAVNVFAVDGGDDVASLQPGFVGGAVLDHVAHQNSLGLFDAKGFSQFRSNILDHHPEPPSRHFAGLELGEDFFHQVYGYGKTNALPLGDNGRIDADDFAVHVEKRPPAVAGVDGGIGLEEIIVRTGANDAPLGTDDACGDRVSQAERVARSHYPVPHPNSGRVSQLRRVWESRRPP